MIRAGIVAYNQAPVSLEEVIMPDVDYLNFRPGFEYNLKPEVRWMTEGAYANLWDYAPYVFGDETGSILLTGSELTIEF